MIGTLIILTCINTELDTVTIRSIQSFDLCFGCEEVKFPGLGCFCIWQLWSFIKKSVKVMNIRRLNLGGEIRFNTSYSQFSKPGLDKFTCRKQHRKCHRENQNTGQIHLVARTETIFEHRTLKSSENEKSNFLFKDLYVRMCTS